MNQKKYLSTILILLIFGCSSNRSSTSISSDKVKKSAQLVFKNSHNSLYLKPYNFWKGTPYKYGGDDKDGIDCSAFVQAVFLEAQNKILPRTTYEQSKLGIKIQLSDAKSGDLVFFKTTSKDKHVGIYLEDQKFMHSSTSKGVVISRLNNPYWASVFWQVRRFN